MPEYHFTGTATLRGVDFYINADSLEEAKKMAADGKYEFLEIDAAEKSDFSIDPKTGAENA